MKYKQLLTAAALSAALIFPGLAIGEATVITGAGPLATNARVDFRITIPSVLRFRVGSAAGTIDLIEFLPSTAVIGDGSDVAATAGSGDQGNGDVTVSVLSNAGLVTITHDTNGASLTDGGTSSIPYTEIITTSSDAANLAAPALGSNTSTTPTLSGSLTNQTATWTYTYDNTAVYDAGVYGGINTNGGRVTYTAATP